jgi:predicted metal-dependent hydrolase
LKKNRTLGINGAAYNIHLIPSDRRTISMRLVSSKDIEVRYPRYIGKSKVFDYVKSKSKWIEKKHALIKAAEESGIGEGIREGRILYYFGKPLKVRTGGDRIEISGSELMIPSGLAEVEVGEWYRMNSEKAVAEFMSLNRDMIPSCTIRVKKQKNIWGSCNSKRRIYINSKISMLPPKVIEYVLWHEICHLNHLNHSKDFYSLLSKMCPAYKEQKAWLKSNSFMLRI